MKKSLLCFLILLMVPLASVAYDFEVDGIYFPFKQNLFVVIVHKYVFHPQQLEKVPIYSRLVLRIYRPVLRPCDFCPNPAQTCLRYA